MGWWDSNGVRRVWEKIKAARGEKQDKLVGMAGQVVGFDSAGNPAAQSTAGLVGPQGDPGLFYGTCCTSAATAAKVVELDGFTLTTGAVVAVKFSYANTNLLPTLNVNNTGAKPIRAFGATPPDTYMWQADEVVEFVYTGVNWAMIRGGIADETYYGVTRLSSSVSSASATEAATPSAVKQAYDLASAALPKSGGTVTGALSVPTPKEDAHAATKAYVDRAAGSVVKAQYISQGSVVYEDVFPVNIGVIAAAVDDKSPFRPAKGLTVNIRMFGFEKTDLTYFSIRIYAPSGYAFNGYCLSENIAALYALDGVGTPTQVYSNVVYSGSSALFTIRDIAGANGYGLMVKGNLCLEAL